MSRKKPEFAPESIEEFKKEFKIDSKEEELALTVNDVDLSPRLGIFHQAFWNNSEHDPRTLDHHDVRFARAHEHMVPITYNGLQEFHKGLKDEKGRWSVVWFEGKPRWHHMDFAYDDNFRRVVLFESIELAIRPVQDDYDIPRLILPQADAQGCLNAAMDALLAANPKEPIAAVTGRASTKNPQHKVKYRDRGKNPNFAFEWKLAHLPPDMLGPRVRKWRCKVFGGHKNLEKAERAFLRFLRTNGLEDPRTDRQFSGLQESGRKRPSGEMGASDESGQSSKRQTTGSQSESDSQSSVSSPEISRPPLLIAPRPTAMGPPPPIGPGQAGMNIQRTARQSRGRRGSRGSSSSASSRVGSRLASLAVESPSEGSPEGVAPPPEGSAWGGHQGMATRDPAQFGGGHGAQMPGHGYQGPGRLPEVPAPGEFTEAYGYLQRVEPSRPRGPPRVGIPHTQFTDQGGWNPPQPGRQQVSAEQAPARRAHQYAGFEGAQSGSRYAYPPSSQSGGQDDRSILTGVPLTESPQLQDLSEAEFEEGDIQPSFHDMPSLPPPAMHTRYPAPFETQTTLSPFGQNYPSSLPPSTQSAFADFIHWPEADDGTPSGFESEWEGEDDQVPVSYPHPPRSHPMQYLVSQDDRRTYYSTPEMGGGISAHENPYMGANRASGDQPAHDDRFIGSYQPDEDQPVYEEPYWSESESEKE